MSSPPGTRGATNEGSRGDATCQHQHRQSTAVLESGAAGDGGAGSFGREHGGDQGPHPEQQHSSNGTYIPPAAAREGAAAAAATARDGVRCVVITHRHHCELLRGVYTYVGCHRAVFRP